MVRERDIQFCAQIWTKIRSTLHARKTARATLHSNKKICKLQKNPSSEPELNLQGHELLIRSLFPDFHHEHVVNFPVLNQKS